MVTPPTLSRHHSFLFFSCVFLFQLNLFLFPLSTNEENLPPFFYPFAFQSAPTRVPFFVSRPPPPPSSALFHPKWDPVPGSFLRSVYPQPTYISPDCNSHDFYILIPVDLMLCIRRRFMHLASQIPSSPLFHLFAFWCFYTHGHRVSVPLIRGASPPPQSAPGYVQHILL